MTVTPQLHPKAFADVDGIGAAAISAGRIGLDESWSPYGQGTIQVPFDDPAIPGAVDPTSGDVRAIITATVSGHWETPAGASTTATGPGAFPGAFHPLELPSAYPGYVAPAGDAPVWVVDDARTFDLNVRRRVVDHESGLASFDLATDEALLQDYAPLVDDSTPRTLETSLRSVVGYVLAKIGATLSPGASDADVTRYWGMTNHATNPNAKVNADDWATSVNASALTPTTMTAPLPPQGNRAMRYTATAAGTSTIVAAGYSTSQSKVVGIRADPYARYSAAYYGYPGAGAGRTIACAIQFRDASGKGLKTVYGPDVAIGSGFTRATVADVEAPPNAAYVCVMATSKGNTAGQFQYVTNVQLLDGSEVVPFFDGATTDTAHYVYGWTGDGSDDSASTRVPYVDAPPEGLIWRGDVDAWDFLAPLITGAGLRLYCDEARVWRLVDDSEYDIPGVVPLEASTLTAGFDEIGREDAQRWAEGVAVRYLWDDPRRGPQERTDVAGTPGRVRTIEYRRPYPGPGAAAYILRSMQSRGRVQTVVALTDYAATPGMESRISLPAAGLVTGRVTSVRFDLDVGVMDVASRGQVVIPGDSWAAVDPGEAWAEVPPADSWDTYTP